MNVVTTEATVGIIVGALFGIDVFGVLEDNLVVGLE
jgi:hypothetical protein